MDLKDVYMVDYVRTPFSKSRPGNPSRSVFSEIRGGLLIGHTLRNMFEKRLKGKVEKEEVSEYLLGCSLPIGTNWAYAGRNSWFAGNMPASVPSQVFDRQCGSAMSAMHHGMLQIMTEYADIIVVSGMEHMFMEPMQFGVQTSWDPPSYLVDDKPDNPWFRADIDMTCGYQMVQTAQKLWELTNSGLTDDKPVSIEEMDRWGVKSHVRAAKALEEGYFKGEIVPIMAHKEGDVNEPELIDYDKSIIKKPNYERTAAISPASTPGYKFGYNNSMFTRLEYKEKFGTKKGAIKAGNSSPLNAGAATCVLMSKGAVESHGMKPMVKLLSMGWAGVDPSLMGLGPIPATKMALDKAGLKVEDIEYWEINEAFAIVTLSCMNHFGIDPETVNVKGGAIAIGHPLGASGVRLPATLARILNEKKAKYGVANLCCGSGQGVAVVIENVNL